MKAFRLEGGLTGWTNVTLNGKNITPKKLANCLGKPLWIATATFQGTVLNLGAPMVEQVLRKNVDSNPNHWTSGAAIYEVLKNPQELGVLATRRTGESS
jgi:hypothetical protein